MARGNVAANVWEPGVYGWTEAEETETETEA